MNQSRLASLIETCIGTAIGLVGSTLLGIVVYPIFGHSFTLFQNIGITLIFTVWSILRGYAIRRWFNAKLHAAADKLAGVVRYEPEALTADEVADLQAELTYRSDLLREVCQNFTRDDDLPDGLLGRIDEALQESRRG